jgi:hypothetical protein
MPKLDIVELKKKFVNTVTLNDQVSVLPRSSPTIIVRKKNRAPTLPILQPGVNVVVPPARTNQDVSNAFGTRPNVPGIEVVNAISNALGPGNWSFHLSDGSFTAYSTSELKEFLYNFDSTNMQVWIAETFDCDNFASVLNGNVQGFFKGIPFGILWFGPKDNSWGHAVNIFYAYWEKRVYCVEPQNDGFFEFNKTLWNPWMVLI